MSDNGYNGQRDMELLGRKKKGCPPIRFMDVVMENMLRVEG